MQRNRDNRTVNNNILDSEKEDSLKNQMFHKWSNIIRMEINQLPNTDGLVSLFNGIPTFMGYLMPKPLL